MGESGPTRSREQRTLCLCDARMRKLRVIPYGRTIANWLGEKTLFVTCRNVAA